MVITVGLLFLVKHERVISMSANIEESYRFCNLFNDPFYNQLLHPRFLLPADDRPAHNAWDYEEYDSETEPIAPFDIFQGQ
jgi:hypothetical protein